jgi:preprotein translocase subunit SecB
MNLSQLQLNRSFYTLVSIAAQQNAKEEDYARIEVEVYAHATRRTPENDRRWIVFVDVELKPKEGAFPAYLGRIKSFGLFSVAESWPQDQIEKLVYVNGGGLLYSGIREMICLISARCPYDTLTIPSVSFLELHKQWLEDRKKDAESPSPTPASAAG